MVVKRYITCQTISKHQLYSNKNCLFKCTYTYKIDVDSQLRKCICGAFSVRMRC